jgi:FMN-dependent NADH-azoreductase
MSESIRILRLDASANPGESSSRRLGDELLERLAREHANIEVRERDLNQTASFIDSQWVAANLTDPAERSEADRQRLSFSDELIAELDWADHILLTTPMYNFSVPATVKAWIDQVCRAGVTFRYTPDGPQGLLEGKRADIVLTTGGVPMDSPVDFASGYLRQVFGFIGIDEVDLIAADRMNIDAEESMQRALQQIDQRYRAAA